MGPARLPYRLWALPVRLVGKSKRFLMKAAGLSADREMPSYVRGVRYTRDVMKEQSYDIGAFTYGTPIVFGQAPGRTPKIAKFCSIAQEVTIHIE